MWGVMTMQSKKNNQPPFQGAPELEKNREAITRLANSKDARQLMDLLEQRGGVRQAARAAAGGDPAQLMAMMSQLMSTKEGARLVERIENQARQAGIK